ncbi:toprim domain-containing protein [Nannocystis pusilla]|uniref:toprim domain-containing protein n=1 Tax=Nannocystis pusilla TaxID=889268 RepID=UPI003B7F7745
MLADRDLARVLPGFGRKLPRWATIGGQTWAEAGIRLVLPVYDASGELVGVRGRWTGPAGHVGVGEGPGEGSGELEASPAGCSSPWSSSAKEVAPWGQRSAGLVFANAAARAMLRGEGVFDVVTVVEGAPDFLTFATLTEAPVIGVFAGSWTAELAARVPDGAQVLLATHADRVGEGYARQVAATLLRRCEVARLRLPPGVDVNDAHRRGQLATLGHDVLEAIDLEVPMELLERPGLCAWDRRALVMLARHGQRFRGGARELARVLLTVAERPLEAVAVKALARALVRLSERRELPIGVVVRASEAERAALELDVGGEVGERDPDAAGQAGEPAVPPVAAHGAGRGPLGQGCRRGRGRGRRGSQRQDAPAP